MNNKYKILNSKYEMKSGNAFGFLDLGFVSNLDIRI
jgi:hypothetical protein